MCVAETAETSDPPGFCQRPAYIFCPQLGFWLVTAIYSVLKHFTVNSSQANVGITRLWPSIKRSHLWWIWIHVSNLHIIKKVALIRYVITPSVKLQLHLKLCGEIYQNAVIFIEIYAFESSAWLLPWKNSPHWPKVKVTSVWTVCCNTIDKCLQANYHQNLANVPVVLCY